MNHAERMMRAMWKPTAWNMARASYSFSRTWGLSRYAALEGAVELYWEYLWRKP